jgi:hypothetical protein
MIATLALTMFLQASPAEPQTFQVRHEHTIGSCTGTLTLSATDIQFEAKEKKHQRTWSYPDVKFFEIVSTAELKIHTYENEGVLKLGSDRDYTFKVAQGQITNELYQFLVAKSPRAVVTRVVFSGTEIVQEIPVRHRHSLGGCQGILTIAQDKVIYKTEHEGDSRIWRLKDLESFASNDPFHLRLSTTFETFNFDLKVPLQEAAYEHIWRALYSPNIQTYGKPKPAERKPDSAQPQDAEPQEK